jgi:hypothetical protein
MGTGKKNIWLLAAIVFAICMTAYMLSEFVIHPQSSMMTLGGDAGKNYLSYFYHCMYDKGVWYHGMNYPYGEHIVYADGQSLLTIPLSYLNQYVHFKRGALLTILNLSIALSYVIGVVYMYKTLLQFRVAPWAAIIFAGLIISLSPQVLRAEVHFALANMCFIPMLFYWFVRYNQGGGSKYMLYTFLLGSLMAFQHPYFGGLLFIWIVLYVTGYWLLQKLPVLKKVKHTLPPIFCLLGVYVVITLFMKLTDPVHDRPVYPYGALQTVTSLQLITTSSLSPIWKFIAAHTDCTISSTSGEGYIYIGITATLVCLVALLAAIVQFANRRQTNTEIAGTGFPAVWLFVGIGSLILAAGIPFVWHMEWLFEYMSILRQFRALGRFGWIFYYIITTYTAVRLYGWYAHAVAKNRIVWAWAILLVPILLWARESKAYMKQIRNDAKGGYYNFTTFFMIYQDTWDDFLAKSQMKGNDFQAVIMLPFIHIGSEKLWLHETEGWVVTLGAKAAIALRLPLVNTMMSRTSLVQTEKQVRLIGGPYADKPLLRDAPGKKPYLLLHFENDSLDPDQQYLLSVSDYIGDLSACHVYVLHPEKLKASDKRYTDSAIFVARNMRVGDSSVYGAGSWYINHYDSGSSTQKLFGTGAAKPVDGDGKHYAVRIPVQPAYADERYEFSTWVLVQAGDYRNPEFDLEIKDSAGRIIKTEHVFGKESTDNRGLWFRVSSYIKLPAHTTAVWCRQSAYNYPCYFALDELMLRPANSIIISKSADGDVMANNHLLGPH